MSDPVYLTVTVDHSKTLAELIAAGLFQFAEPDITAAHFPPSGSGQITAKLVVEDLDCDGETDKALAQLDFDGFQPGKLPGLLALAAAAPEEQRKSPILALGSVWTKPNGEKVCPALSGTASERSLVLVPYEDYRNKRICYLGEHS